MKKYSPETLLAAFDDSNHELHALVIEGFLDHMARLEIDITNDQCRALIADGWQP